MSPAKRSLEDGTDCTPRSVATFSTAAVLSAGTGFLLGEFSELHKLVEHVCGFPVWTHQLIRLGKPVGQEVVRQLGAWAGNEAFFEKLSERLRPVLVDKERSRLVAEAVASYEAEHGVGKTHAIESRAGLFEQRHPIDEMAEIAPGKPIVAVVVDRPGESES